VLVVLLVVAVVIVGGVAMVAMGQGGEMAMFAPDDPPEAAVRTVTEHDVAPGLSDLVPPEDHEPPEGSG
jgi:hypothetical protein